MTARRALAILAVMAAALAVVLGDPPRSTSAPSGAAAADEVGAIQLAEWIRDHRSGLRLIDLRGAQAYETDHLPGAQLPAAQSPPAPGAGETLVVYSQADAAEARARARAAGFSSALVLRGGYQAWGSEVLNPTLALDASAAQEESFRRISELSRYFGGQPRRGASQTAESGSWMRRGC